MKILKEGIDIYDRINQCNLCGCIFQTNHDDATVFFENDVCKHYVECPSCYDLILVGISRQSIFFNKQMKREEKEDEVR